jgi:glycosyltransferase involved in cell wall biosynthesis
VLKGLKDGRFHTTLMSPAPSRLPEGHKADLAQLCDEFLSWPEPHRGRLFPYTRLRHVVSSLPVPIATDRSVPARVAVKGALARADVVVVDFLHAAVLMPSRIEIPSVLFTHNVEAEIFTRHLEVSRDPVRRVLWRDQLRKMRRFEAKTLRRYDSVVAVSNRDRDYFRREYDVRASTIPTGVDLDYFAFQAPVMQAVPPAIAFTASMDSLANIDGVRWFMDEVWPLVVRAIPDAQMRVIGRNPDPALVAEAKRRGLAWQFTGYVDDVRPHLEGASVYVIPLRVGGGTRIKAYEAMAFGLPTVSTAVGVEGLNLEAGKHYLEGDTGEAFAAAVVNLLGDRMLRRRLAADARALVEHNFSARSVGVVFEAICIAAMEAHRLQRANVSGNPARTPGHGTSAA